MLLQYLHKENMGHIQLPGVMLITKLNTLPEDLLHHCVVTLVPIYLSLRKGLVQTLIG